MVQTPIILYLLFVFIFIDKSLERINGDYQKPKKKSKTKKRSDGSPKKF